MPSRNRTDPAERPLFRALAAGCAGLVLLLALAAACPSLHAWLHGEKQVDADDACAVVLYAAGAVPAAAAAAVVALFAVRWGEAMPAPAGPLLREPAFRRPPGRAPPA